MIAGAAGAGLTLTVTSGAAGSAASVAVALSVLAAMSIAALIVTAPDPDWAPGRSERVLRALLATPAVVVTLQLAATLSGDGAVPRERLAGTVVVLAAALILVGTSAARRPCVRAEWAPPLAGGAAAIPPLCRAFKRLVDIVLGSIAVVLTLPVLAVAIVAIKCDSKGPWLFRQTRIGAGGHRFTVLKLRTMRTNNDETEHQNFVTGIIRGQGTPTAKNGGMFKLTDDPRITRVGRVLRRLSIDELPQLFNVLCGTMSLVGPRPPLPREVAIYGDRARQRLAVKPGMTGLWQVSGRSRLTFEEMVELDIQYWTQWTPLLEMRILARTPKVALVRRETA